MKGSVLRFRMMGESVRVHYIAFPSKEDLDLFLRHMSDCVGQVLSITTEEVNAEDFDKLIEIKKI